jgi:hypothetical protein
MSGQRGRSAKSAPPVSFRHADATEPAGSYWGLGIGVRVRATVKALDLRAWRNILKISKMFPTLPGISRISPAMPPEKKKGAVKVTSALCSNQFVEYLRDHLLLDKCVD